MRRFSAARILAATILLASGGSAVAGQALSFQGPVVDLSPWFSNGSDDDPSASVEVWVEQMVTAEQKYYRLEGAAPGVDELTGLFDRTGFLP